MDSHLNLVPTVSPLSVTSLSPTTAAAGGSAFTLTVNGTGFASSAVAQWNGTALTTTFLNATQLTAEVPAGLIASAGTAVVSVVEGGSTIGSAPFAVNAPGQSCNFASTPPGAGIGAGGGSASVSVTASRSDCTWTATSDSPWITFVNNPNTGSAPLNYSVAVNPAGTSRTGTITIGAQTFEVNQGGTVGTYSLPNSSQAFTAAGGSGTAAVQAPPGCNWTASSGVPWVIVGAPGSGSGDGTATYTVAPNPSTSPRSAMLTIANQPYIVTEEGSGNDISCTASVPSAPQVAIEGRTEVAGGLLLNCSGLSGAVKADISLALNANVTNALANGVTDAVLTVNGGSPQNGLRGRAISGWATC